MKRAIISMCCALAIFLHVSAQIKYGVKGGVNLTNVVNSFDRSGGVDPYSINNRIGFFFGPTALIATPIKDLEFDASIMFDQRGAEMKTPDLIGSPTFKTTITHQQLTIPVNIRYNLISGNSTKVFVLAGPQLGINIGKKEYELDYGDMVFNSASFGINAGIGLFLGQHIQVSANYNMICGKSAGYWINRRWDIGQEIGNGRINAWQFSVGYYF